MKMQTGITTFILHYQDFKKKMRPMSIAALTMSWANSIIMIIFKVTTSNYHQPSVPTLSIIHLAHCSPLDQPSSLCIYQECFLHSCVWLFDCTADNCRQLCPNSWWGNWVGATTRCCGSADWLLWWWGTYNLRWSFYLSQLLCTNTAYGSEKVMKRTQYLFWTSCQTVISC